MANGRIASGYAFDRPRLHKRVLAMALKEDLSGGRFLHGLDVGCGAGLSAEALGRHCRKVTGVDISPVSGSCIYVSYRFGRGTGAGRRPV